MKTLLLTSACAALVIGASGIAFAADQSGSTSAIEPGSQQTAFAQQGELGRWPHRWGKDDERAATQALNQLEVHGYARFSNFHKKGNDFEANVMEGGKPIRVLVDPAKDTVTQEG